MRSKTRDQPRQASLPTLAAQCSLQPTAYSLQPRAFMRQAVDKDKRPDQKGGQVVICHPYRAMNVMHMYKIWHVHVHVHVHLPPTQCTPSTCRCINSSPSLVS